MKTSMTERMKKILDTFKRILPSLNREQLAHVEGVAEGMELAIIQGTHEKKEQ